MHGMVMAGCIDL